MGVHQAIRLKFPVSSKDRTRFTPNFPPAFFQEEEGYREEAPIKNHGSDLVSNLDIYWCLAIAVNLYLYKPTSLD